MHSIKKINSVGNVTARRLTLGLDDECRDDDMSSVQIMKTRYQNRILTTDHSVEISTISELKTINQSKPASSAIISEFNTNEKNNNRNININKSFEQIDDIKFQCNIPFVGADTSIDCESDFENDDNHSSIIRKSSLVSSASSRSIDDEERSLTRRKRKVRFDIIDANDVEGKDKKSWVHKSNLTKEEETLMWSSIKEIKVFKKEAKQLARAALLNNEARNISYIETFSHVYDLAAVGDSTTFKKPFSILSNTSNRGLELFMFPGLIKDRRRCIRNVIKVQSKLPKVMDIQQKNKVLADLSGALSRPAKLIARALGNADAIVAFDVHKRTFLS